MLTLIKNTYLRLFGDPEAIVLFMTIVLSILFIKLAGSMIAPILVSVIIAYLLNAILKFVKRLGCPDNLAISLVLLLFISAIFSVLFLLFPLLWKQAANLINEFPFMLTRGQAYIDQLPKQYPNIITVDEISTILDTFKTSLVNMGQFILSFSISSISNLIQLVIYLVLVPLLVFFLLKDQKQLIQWVSQFLPRKSRIVYQVWHEINIQFGNYIQGRILELLIVAVIASLVFSLMKLKFALLLGVLLGLSTVIPFVGAVIVTIPIVIIAFLQWGLSSHFFYLMIAYTIMIIIDGNLIVPLLFSGVMNLHPIAIIASVLFFGNIWGFWGIFFAIPLATVIKAVLTAWPIQTHFEKQHSLQKPEANL